MDLSNNIQLSNMEQLTKRGNMWSKYPPEKYYTRRYIGFLKQVADQLAKPEVSQVDTGLKTYDFENGGYKPLMQEHFNDKWNGMNLKCLLNAEIKSPATIKNTGYYSTHPNRRINKETGMHRLRNEPSGNTNRKLKLLREKYQRHATT